MKLIKILLFCGLLFITSCSNYCENYLFSFEVDGVIVKKFRDTHNFNSRVLKIVNKKGFYKTLVIQGNNSVWNFVENGYGIVKEPNTYRITIIRNKEKFDFDLCQNEEK